MKSLDQLRSLSGASKSFSFSSRPSSDSISSGGFANLKLTAGSIRNFGSIFELSPKNLNGFDDWWF